MQVYNFCETLVFEHRRLEINVLLIYVTTRNGKKRSHCWVTLVAGKSSDRREINRQKAQVSFAEIKF